MKRKNSDLGLAALITKAASKQTYYTIRLLADRERVADAFRAYAYFRWVDDSLDAEAGSRSAVREVEASERSAFVNRQKSLLEECYRGESPRDVNPEEKMLVEFDSKRRGKEQRSAILPPQYDGGDGLRRWPPRPVDLSG